MFPDTLDGARVLYHTPEGDYGEILFTTGEVYAYRRYFAICQYENENCFYLFGCDSNFEVIGDSLWDSIEECMSVAANTRKQGLIWVKSK